MYQEINLTFCAVQFRRYHQSDIVSLRKSVIGGAWWTGAREVNVEGRSSLLKQYDGHREYATRVKREFIFIYYFMCVFDVDFP